jgi:hypothetical protein
MLLQSVKYLNLEELTSEQQWNCVQPMFFQKVEFYLCNSNSCSQHDSFSNRMLYKLSVPNSWLSPTQNAKGTLFSACIS